MQDFSLEIPIYLGNNIYQRLHLKDMHSLPYFPTENVSWLLPSPALVTPHWSFQVYASSLLQCNSQQKVNPFLNSISVFSVLFLEVK